MSASARICAGVLGVALFPIGEASARTAARLTTTDAAIYAAVIDATADHGRWYLVVDRTLDDDRISRRALWPDADGGTSREPISPSLSAAFRAVNRRPAFVPRFRCASHLRFVSRPELDAVFKRGVRGWRTFYLRYRGSGGYYEFSRPAFTRDGNAALVYYRWSAAGTAGTSALLYLRRQNDKWSIRRTLAVTKI